MWGLREAARRGRECGSDGFPAWGYGLGSANHAEGPWHGLYCTAWLSALQTSHGTGLQMPHLVTRHMASRQAGTGATRVLFRLSLGVFLSVFKPVQCFLVFFSSFSP